MNIPLQSTDPCLLHPERLTDPHWQWKRRSRKGIVARMQSWGVKINPAKIQAHYDLVSRQSTSAAKS